jgi:hypothetical protein
MWMLNIAISIENDVLNHQFVINQDGDIMGISWVYRTMLSYGKWKSRHVFLLCIATSTCQKKLTFLGPWCKWVSFNPKQRQHGPWKNRLWSSPFHSASSTTLRMLRYYPLVMTHSLPWFFDGPNRNRWFTEL